MGGGRDRYVIHPSNTVSAWSMSNILVGTLSTILVYELRFDVYTQLPKICIDYVMIIYVNLLLILLGFTNL